MGRPVVQQVVRPLLPHDLPAPVRAGDLDHAKAVGARQLHKGDAHPFTGAIHQ